MENFSEDHWLHHQKPNFNSYIYTLFLDHFSAQIGAVRSNLCKLCSSEKLLTCSAITLNCGHHDFMSIECYFDQSRCLLSMTWLDDQVTWSTDLHLCMKPVGLKWFTWGKSVANVNIVCCWFFLCVFYFFFQYDYHTSQSSWKFVGHKDITGKNRLGPINITASQDRLSDEIFKPKM